VHYHTEIDGFVKQGNCLLRTQIWVGHGNSPLIPATWEADRRTESLRTAQAKVETLYPKQDEPKRAVAIAHVKCTALSRRRPCV
jgi:hypothetical protein